MADNILGATQLPKPNNRRETFLAKAAGLPINKIPAPVSREEIYLYAIAESGGGGGGTANFNKLINRPLYAGAPMTGATEIPKVVTYIAGTNISINNGIITATDTTYETFVGTDGVENGASGLVPAPMPEDSNKFLKSDGTWTEVSGGVAYTAGEGIKIKNGVISVSYANGDEESYGND